jgi:glutaredoxin
MEILIIGKEDCSLCKSAQEFSKVKNVEFTYKKVPEDLSLEKAYEITRTMFRQFPAIVVDDEFVGGFSDYQRFIKNNL